MAVVRYCECRHHHIDGGGVGGPEGRSHRHRHHASHHENAIAHLHLESSGLWHEEGTSDECRQCRMSPRRRPSTPTRKED